MMCIGDVVQLNGKGIGMVVADVIIVSEDDAVISCLWFDDDFKLRQAMIPMRALTMLTLKQRTA